MKQGLGASVAFWAIFVSGCGTIVNVTSGDLYPYGGVVRDCQFINHSLTQDTSSSNQGKGGAIALLGLVPAEASLSFVGDTVTLPIVLYLHRNVANYDPVDGHDNEPPHPSPPQEPTPAPNAAVAGETTLPVSDLKTASP